MSKLVDKTGFLLTVSSVLTTGYVFPLRGSSPLGGIFVKITGFKLVMVYWLFKLVTGTWITKE